jgi:hypothetical protein
VDAGRAVEDVPGARCVPVVPVAPVVAVVAPAAAAAPAEDPAAAAALGVVPAGVEPELVGGGALAGLGVEGLVPGRWRRRLALLTDVPRCGYQAARAASARAR